MIESTDPYTYLGTSVLKNLRGIREARILARYEAESTTRRITELIHAPVQGRFDIDHLKVIHEHIFQDVYSWAGEFRTVNISKGGQLFGAAAFVDPALRGLLQQLPGENYLKALDAESFAARAGFYLGEINAVHVFRDGNGRAQREFVRSLGRKAGFAIDWSRVTRDQMIAASRESFETGDSSGLAALIRTSIR